MPSAMHQAMVHILGAGSRRPYRSPASTGSACDSAAACRTSGMRLTCATASAYRTSAMPVMLPNQRARGVAEGRTGIVILQDHAVRHVGLVRIDAHEHQRERS